jgi:hypothetical protein
MQRRILTESRRQSVGSKARHTHARTSQPFPQPVPLPSSTCDGWQSIEYFFWRSLSIPSLFGIFSLQSNVYLGGKTQHYSYDCTPCANLDPGLFLVGRMVIALSSISYRTVSKSLSWAKMEQELPPSPSLWSRALSLIQISKCLLDFFFPRWRQIIGFTPHETVRVNGC